jgi:hypothetical protein
MCGESGSRHSRRRHASARLEIGLTRQLNPDSTKGLLLGPQRCRENARHVGVRGGPAGLTAEPAGCKYTQRSSWAATDQTGSSEHEDGNASIDQEPDRLHVWKKTRRAVGISRKSQHAERPAVSDGVAAHPPRIEVRLRKVGGLETWLKVGPQKHEGRTSDSDERSPPIERRAER